MMTDSNLINKMITEVERIVDDLIRNGYIVSIRKRGGFTFTVYLWHARTNTKIRVIGCNDKVMIVRNGMLKKLYSIK